MKEFVVIGLSYKKANEEIRGRFSLSEEQQTEVLTNAKKENSIGFIISTCNRTEIYALAEDVDDIFKKWNEVTTTNLNELKEYLYILKGKKAINHLFRVACGLQSQILGDFEITNQLKKSFVFAKKIGTTNGYLERLVNIALQASKEVRSKTKISNGTTSVSYVTVDYIKNKVDNYTQKKVLLYGLGEIGKLTVENLCKHLPATNISVINRSENKSHQVAAKFKVNEFDHSDLNRAINDTDILIVATNSQTPTITKANITSNKSLTIFDLSIPKNVDKCIDSIGHIKSLGLDELSQTINQTITKRRAEIPSAETIITKHKKEFGAWASNQIFADVTKAFKTQMLNIKTDEIEYQKKKLTDANEDHLNAISDRIIQKITTKLVTQLKDEKDEIQRMSQISLIKNMFNL
jgi:glutamyl-tRNA reductase